MLLIFQLEDREFFVEFWDESLNPLTWVEILRQVLVAAGFNTNQGSVRKESLSKVLLMRPL